MFCTKTTGYYIFISWNIMPTVDIHLTLMHIQRFCIPPSLFCSFCTLSFGIRTKCNRQIWIKINNTHKLSIWRFLSITFFNLCRHASKNIKWTAIWLTLLKKIAERFISKKKYLVKLNLIGMVKKITTCYFVTAPAK